MREQNGEEDIQLFQKEGAGADNYKRFEVVHFRGDQQRAARENFRVVVQTQEIEIEKNLHGKIQPRIRSTSQKNGIAITTKNRGNERKGLSELEWSTNSLSTYKNDDWKVQGQGVIEIPESGFYSFAHDVSNGSLKLRINEQLIVNSNHNTTGHFKSDPYYFEAGKLIPIHLNFETTERFERSDAGFKIYWGHDKNSAANIDSYERIDKALLYRSREEANSVVIEKGTSTAEFFIETYDDNIDQGDFNYAIKVVENADDINYNKEGVPKSAQSAYRAPDYNFRIEIDNIELQDKFDGESIDPEARTYKADLTWKPGIDITDYSLKELQRIAIVDNKDDDEQLYFDLADRIDLGSRLKGQEVTKKGVRLIANYSLDEKIKTNKINSLDTKLPIDIPLRLKIRDNDSAGYVILNNDMEPINSAIDLYERKAGKTTDFYIKLRSEPADFVKLIGEINTNLVKIGSTDAFKVSNDIGRIEFNFNQRNFDQPQKFSLTPIDDKTKFGQVNKSLVAFTSQSLDRKYNQTNLLGVDGQELQTFCPEEGCDPDRWSPANLRGQKPKEEKERTERQELRQLERLSGDNHYIVPSNAPLVVKVKDNDKPSIKVRSSNNGQLNEGDNEAYYAYKLGTKPTENVNITLSPLVESNFLLSLEAINIGNKNKSTNISLKASRIDRWNEDEEDTYRTTTVIPAHSVLNFYDNKGRLVRFSNDKRILIKPKNLDLTKPPKFDSDGEIIRDEIIVKRGEQMKNISGHVIAGENHMDEVNKSVKSPKLTSVRGFNSIYNTRPRFKLANQIVPEPYNLSFTPDNWNKEQYVQINPYDDRVFNGDAIQAIDISVDSEDRHYAKIKDNSVNVEIIDDDRPRARLYFVTDGTENAEPGRFRVALDSNPDTTDNSSGIEVHYEITVEHVDEDVTYKGKDGEILEGDKRLSSIIQNPKTQKGSVLIPPGQLFSDEIVVPIDDFRVQTKNNKINISIVDDPNLSSSESNKNGSSKPSYLVSDEHERQATMQFIDNDKAGLLLIFPGNQLMVEEGDRGAQMFVMLTSQPRNDVSIGLKEVRDPLFQDRASGQLADRFSPNKPDHKRPQLTFNAKNWFIPQIFTIAAKLDQYIEDHVAGSDDYEYIYAEIQESIFEGEDDAAVNNYFILREKDQAKSFKETIVSDGASSDTGRHKAQLEITIDSDDPDYNESVLEENILDLIVLDAQLPDDFMNNIESSLAGVESLVTAIDYPLIGNLKSENISNTFDISSDFRDAYESSANSTVLAISDAFENAHKDDMPTSLNAGEISAKTKSYRSDNKDTEREFKIIVNEHVDKLTVQGLNLGGKGKHLLMNPLGLSFSNPNDDNDNVIITTDVRVQPEARQEGDKTIYSNHEYIVPLNRNDRIRLTGLIRRVRGGEKRNIQVSRAAAMSLISSDKRGLEATAAAAIDSWNQDQRMTVVNRPTSEWDMDQGFSVTSNVTTTDDGQVVLNANVKWQARQQIAALPMDFSHNEGGGSEGGMTFASKSDLGIDTFLNLEIALDLNFPIADLNGGRAQSGKGGSNGPSSNTGSGELGPVDLASNTSENDSSTSRAVRKYRNAKSRQIESIIKYYSSPNKPSYMVPSAVMNALQSLREIGSRGWINTENSGIKFSISSEPTGSFMASFNGATVRFKNVPCTTDHCVKELADGDEAGISTKLELAAFARPREQAAGTNRLEFSQITQRGFRDSFTMGITLDSALSLASSLGIQTEDEIQANALRQPSWWPSFGFGIAHKFPDAIQGARNSFRSGNVQEKDLPSSINSGEPDIAQVSSSSEPGPNSLDDDNTNNDNATGPTEASTRTPEPALTNEQQARRSDNNGANNTSGNNSNAPVLFNVNMKLGDFLTNTLNPTVRNIDDSFQDIYPVLDVLYGDIAFFRAFDRSISRAMDTDNDGNVTIMDIVMNAARVAAKVGGSKGRGLCEAVSVLNVLGSKLNQFANLIRPMGRVSRANERLDNINRAFNFYIPLEKSPKILRLNMFGGEAEVKLRLERNQGANQLSPRFFNREDKFKTLGIPKGSKADLLTKNEQEFVREIPITGFSQLGNSKRIKLNQNGYLINDNYSLSHSSKAPIRTHYTWSSLAYILIKELRKKDTSGFRVGEVVNSLPQINTRSFKSFDDLYLFLNDLMQAPSTPGQSSLETIYKELKGRLKFTDKNDIDFLLRTNNYEYLDHILRDVRRTVITRQAQDASGNAITVHSIRENLPDKISKDLNIRDFQRASFDLQLLEEYVLGSAVSPIQTDSTPIQNVRNTAANAAGIRSLCDAQSISNDMKNVRPGVDFNRLTEFAGNPTLFSAESIANSESISPIPESASQRGRFSRGANSISEFGNRMMRVLEGANAAGFYFPLFQDREALLNIIFGDGNIDLMTYTLPTLQAEAAIDLSKPLGVIRPRLSGSLGLHTRFGFGMDSSGFTRWRDEGSRSDNLEMIMDGFYIADRWSYNPAAQRWLANPFGRDMRELAIEGRFGVGLEGNLGVIRGIVEGGVFADIGFDFVDVGELQGTSDGRIRGYEMETMFRNPTEAIAFGGGIHFFLQAAIQIGIDLGFIDVWHDLWSAELARMTLAEFSTVDRSSSSQVGNDPYRNATVFFDANSNFAPDVVEPTTRSTLDGSFSMGVDTRFFSPEDIKKGQLVAFAGEDTAINRMQSTPFTAPVGTPLTPLTTFRSLMIKHLDAVNSQSVNKNEKDKEKDSEDNTTTVDAFIRKHFGIKDFDFTSIESTQFLATEKSLSNRVVRSAANDYLAHIKLNFLYSAVENLLQHGLPELFNNGLQDRFERMSIISTHIFNDLSNGRDPLSGDHEYIARELLGGEYLNDNSEEYTDETTKFVASLVEQAADMSQSLWQKLDRRLEHSESDSALDFVSEILPVKRQYFDELNLLSTNISLISESFKSEISSKNAMFSLREGEFFDGSPNHDFLAHFNREGNQPEVFGKAGDDVLLGSTGSDALFGNSGSDIVIGGPKSDELFGGVGDDDLQGDGGKDFLFGGPGNDQLDGGMSDDNLSGGTGQDTFVYNGGDDVIRDFSFRRPNSGSKGIDILKTNFDLDDDSIEIERPQNTGNTVLLTFDDNNSLKFANIPLAIFNQDDFISTLKDHLA